MNLQLLGFVLVLATAALLGPSPFSVAERALAIVRVELALPVVIFF